jgi:hypothetical protein
MEALFILATSQKKDPLEVLKWGKKVNENRGRIGAKTY